MDSGVLNSPHISSITLENRSLSDAREAARRPWYASLPAGLFAVGAAVLLLLTGFFGTNNFFLAGGAFLLVAAAPFALLMFLGGGDHRDAVQDVRAATKIRRAWMVTGPIVRTGPRSMTVRGRDLRLIQDLRLRDPSGSAIYEVIFADNTVGAAAEAADVNVGTVISVTGPDGSHVYPAAGLRPLLLRTPSLVASIIFSIGATAAFNSLAGTYETLAGYEKDIEAATPCVTGAPTPADCFRWVSGNVTYVGHRVTTPGTAEFSSPCAVLLQWDDTRQEGAIRADGVDCSSELSRRPEDARIELVRDYAIQVDVSDLTFKTDRWPPFGSTVIALALIFRIASIFWLAWPFVHLGAAAAYRLLQAAKS